MAKTQYQDKKANRGPRKNSTDRSEKYSIDGSAPKAAQPDVVRYGGADGKSVPGMVTNVDRKVHIDHQNSLDKLIASRGKGAFGCPATDGKTEL